NGAYTVNKEDLVVSLPNDSDLHYDLYSVGNGDEANLVRVSSDKLEDVRLARYYHVNEGYADQLYCEAKSNNDRANKLCGKLLQGMEIASSDSNYKTYLLNDEINEALCKAKLFWSNTNNTCYMTEAARCTAHGMSMQGSGTDAHCGYANNQYANKTVKEGGKCIDTGADSRCISVTFDAGAECIAKQNDGCRSVTVKTGGRCVTDPDAGITSDACYGQFPGGTCEGNTKRACLGSTYSEGGTCVGSADAACTWGTIRTGSTCEGRYSNACTYNYFEAGSTCEGYVSGACSASMDDRVFAGTCNGWVDGACGSGKSAANQNLTFGDGAVCNGKASGSCKGIFDAGSRCVAEVAGACAGIYRNGGCCVGAHCPEGTACQS
ncbi:MAG: hypothetical protein IKO35_05055, partial [Elusimicrobiaceae bacterium]|nr:hypothetical protein [Elusimicrobiaceae bacterium]